MSKISRNEIRKKKHFRIRNKILKNNRNNHLRVNVFKSLRNFEAQLIDDETRKTLIHVSTLKLKLENGGNLNSAQEVGHVFGKELIKQGYKKIIFDRSGYIFHGKIKAFVEAMKEEGVEV